jgi:hypothetical protein
MVALSSELALSVALGVACEATPRKRNPHLLQNFDSIRNHVSTTFAYNFRIHSLSVRLWC